MSETTSQNSGVPSEAKSDGLWTTIVLLLPSIIGLAFARAGLIVASYGSYRNTDEDIFTDGPMIATLLILLAFFAVLTAKKTILAKQIVNRIARTTIVAETACILGIAAVYLTDTDNFALHFGLNVLCTLFASASMYYWLRRLRGTGTVTSVVFVFSALILSEFELYLTAQLPVGVGVLIAGVLCAVQLPCIPWARGRVEYHSTTQLSKEQAFMGFGKETLRSRWALIAMAVGIGLISIVDGFLRGYPDGTAIPFSPMTRLAYGALTVLISVGIIAAVVHGKEHMMSVGTFVIIELLACTALFLYSAFPNALDIGAVPTTVLNALLVAFSWYIIIAFMSYGWRDPYYYAMAGWFVWLGARAATRTLFLVISPLVQNPVVSISVIGTLVVVSAQITFLMLLSIAQRTFEAQEENRQAPTIVRIMGLDKDQDLATVRQESMRHSIEILGSQFLLSEREMDVLTLYAQGFTQKKVAEELFITPSTAHAHIKRIYAKTGMHSRQEILDYLAENAS